jgi:metallo-beta-lactamase family protein
MNKKEATVTFCGGAMEPTGSNFLFTTPETSILIDCGLFQGEKILDAKNLAPFIYDPKKIDVLFVTHAHLDHIGRIPKLVKEGFKGKIYSTPPTKEITELLLQDSVRILTRQAMEQGVEPPYVEEDVFAIMDMWETVGYHKDIKVNDELSVKFFDSGHVLGSSMAQVTYGDKKMLFTGDLGNTPAPLMHDTEIPEDISYMVMESVYGDRNHEGKPMRREMLRQVILDVIEKQGVLMIPVFSVERTQEMLFELNHFVENDQIPLVPVFLDSPLAIKVTEIYKKYQNYFNTAATDIIKSGDDLFKFPMLRFMERREDSMKIGSVEGAKIIMAGSGMSNGGRILMHEKKYLPDPNNTLILAGYQAVGTLGRKLEDGAKTVEIDEDSVNVRAKIVTINGYSAHKDSDNLLAFAESIAEKGKLEKIFVAMGEPKAALALSQKINDNVGKMAEVAQEGKSVVLEF